MKRPIGIWSAPLRDWQEESFRKSWETFEGGKKKDFTEIATPGGGKTRSALRKAHKLLQLRYVDRIVVTVPSDHLRKQWATDASKYGLDLDPCFQNIQQREHPDYHGVVITYQSLGMNSFVHKQNVDSSRTLLLGDEWHHTGDEMTWGDMAKTVFENAAFRILLSGTLFRNDNNRIPFVEYADGMSKADYSYSYRRAIEDNVCRPVYFTAIGGEMEWRINGKHYRHTFEDNLDDERSSERLRTALSTKGKWIRELIREADTKLTEIRQTHSNAGGLLIAIDQKHAKSIAQLVYHITGEYPTIVVSEDKDASANIESFANGRQRWLVAVKMVTEGIDIPRLRVGAYATNIKSELFFRQFVGRFVRIIQGLNGAQDAVVFIPADKELIKFAHDIEVEREHALSNRLLKYGENPFFDEPERKQYKNFEEISAEATSKKMLNTRFASGAMNLFGISGLVTEMVAEAAVDLKIDSLKNSVAVESEPLFLKEKKLRSEINELAKIGAKEKFGGNGNVINWQYYHELWIKEMGGRNIEQETLPELERRAAWLRKVV